MLLCNWSNYHAAMQADYYAIETDNQNKKSKFCDIYMDFKGICMYFF